MCSSDLLGCFTRAEKQRAMAALARVGMAQYAAQRASTLSGGQQQRGAIARALVQGAEVVLADEPIASLDPASSRRVMQMLKDLNRDGVTVLVSLHQVDFAREFCQRIVALRDGEVVFDGAGARLDDDTLRDLYGDEAVEVGLAEEHPRHDPQPDPAPAPEPAAV